MDPRWRGRLAGRSAASGAGQRQAGRRRRSRGDGRAPKRETGGRTQPVHACAASSARPNATSRAATDRRDALAAELSDRRATIASWAPRRAAGRGPGGGRRGRGDAGSRSPTRPKPLGLEL